MQIPIAHPLIDQEEADAVLSVLASGTIAQGPVAPRQVNGSWELVCGLRLIADMRG